MNSRALFIAAIVLVSLSIAVVGGCNAGDVVQVKTPPSLVADQELPASMSLNEATQSFEHWLTGVETSAIAWTASIERGEQVRQTIEQIATVGLGELAPNLAGVPILGPAVPLLAGLGGLFLKRPSDVSQAALRSEKESSYNAGLKRAREMISGSKPAEA